MGKHTIYINEKLESEIRDVANKIGCSLTDVVRKRLDTSSTKFQSEIRLKKMEDKIDAIYSLLDLLAGEVGYIAGATRASTKSIEHIKIEGATFENHVRRTASALRKNFEAQEPIEEGA